MCTGSCEHEPTRRPPAGACASGLVKRVREQVARVPILKAGCIGPTCLPCAEFIPYAGEGYAVLIPGKYNPSGERDFKGTVLR